MSYNTAMSLELTHPQKTIDTLVEFIQKTFLKQQKTTGVIAVSGGIDSALSLTLLAQALGKEHVIPVVLPYSDQKSDDNYAIIDFLQIPRQQVKHLNIEAIVDAGITTLRLGLKDQVRVGNLKARARMMCVFDIAKANNGLVCGTENKSEHYLGYFTRFGDAASDIEPLCQLYKTQVRQLVKHLGLPEVFLTKAPSAGLWVGQTDEEEMGFTYAQADAVMEQFIDQKVPAENINIAGISPEIVTKITGQIQHMAFKLEVPYEPK